MLSLLKKILGSPTESHQLEDDAEQNAHVALCVLLLEAAHADGECSKNEMDHLTSTLIKEFDVPRQDIAELVATGRRERAESVDLFRFTRYMNNNFSREDKIAAMVAVWRIILIDAHLEAHEDHFAHKLANLLRLTHKELIDAKLQARKQLAGHPSNIPTP